MAQPLLVLEVSQRVKVLVLLRRQKQKTKPYGLLIATPFM